MTKGNRLVVLDKVVEDKEVINISLIQRTAGFSYAYTWQLLHGKRKNQEALKQVRDALVIHYGGLLKDISVN